MDLFVRNFFSRLFIVLEEMSELKSIIDNADQNPRSLTTIRDTVRG